LFCNLVVHVVRCKYGLRQIDKIKRKMVSILLNNDMIKNYNIYGDENKDI